MNYRVTIDKIQAYVHQCFQERGKPELYYHNVQHTEDVVTAVTQIGNHYQLSDEDFFVVTAAAWLHDIGYLQSQENHEEISKTEARKLLSDLQVGEAVIQKVEGCILATRMPQQPHNRLEEMICDADLFHLGTDTFSESNKQMRKEYNAVHHTKIDKAQWRSQSISFLRSNEYHTDYCRLLLTPGKEKNLQLLMKKQPENEDKKTFDKPVADAKEETKEGKEKKEKRAERGINTMLRLSSQNHQHLSEMADNKAHILITVNSIIISAVATLLLRKLEENAELTIPAILLLIVSLVSIVLSIIATRPQLSSGKFTDKDIDEKKVNLLFFGSFYRTSLEEYSEGMQKVMGSEELVYSTLIRDIYSQGVVLGRKYRILRLTYSIFMYGLIISVLSFIVATIISTPV